MQQSPEEQYVTPYTPPDYLAAVLHHKQSGSLLDLGCGRGNQSLFFAEHGFIVDALDNDEDNLMLLGEEAQNRSLAINLIVADMHSYEFEKAYDVIVAKNSIYFATQTVMKRTVEKIQDATKILGVNSITVWSDQNPEHEIRTPVDKNFLLRSYAKWILKQPWRATSPTGQVFHALLAVKPSQLDT